ncbi:hypothetical protein [Bosea sp. ASV33]|uniref:hypothetical protein n=1 Tax=Bosea sp. ASV33 TaxID=2795106 RepID=UPI0018ECDD37|nr:hypothetical protein [Bosea sp. ASV33]
MIAYAIGLALAIEALTPAKMPRREPEAGDPYADVRDMMVDNDYTPVPQPNGCKATMQFGDFRCSLYPELHRCDFEAPSTCIAEWRHPKGHRLVVIVEGWGDFLHFRAAGRPKED